MRGCGSAYNCEWEPRDLGVQLNSSLHRILETVDAAKTTMTVLHDRASTSASIDDRCELSVLGTTVRKIEELLEIAAAYEDVLMRQLKRTRARIDDPCNSGT